MSVARPDPDHDDGTEIKLEKNKIFSKIITIKLIQKKSILLVTLH